MRGLLGSSRRKGVSEEDAVGCAGEDAGSGDEGIVLEEQL